MPKCFCGNYESFKAAVNDEYTLAPPPEVHPLQYKTLVKPDGVYFSNNPYFVSCFEHENVFVCGKEHITCITEHPNYKKWKDEMDSGELWSLWGESWVD